MNYFIPHMVNIFAKDRKPACLREDKNPYNSVIFISLDKE